METAACSCACAVGIEVLFSGPSVSLKQCGESRCGTVSPHGPGDIIYPTSLIVILVSLSCLVKKLLRSTFRDSRSVDKSVVDSSALKMI